MPKITPGNHLYFYQLFSVEMGVGKQTPIARVEEILVEADVLLEDVECESIEELLGALSDFVKLTVFKKGRVFATIMAREDLDEQLEKAAQPVIDKAAAAAGKSWKRARRSKDIRPTKPRHKRAPKLVEDSSAQAPAEEAKTTEQPVASDEQIETQDKTVEAREATEPEATEVPEQTPATEMVEMVPEIAHEPETIPNPEPEPELAQETEARAEPESESETEQEQELEPEEEPELGLEQEPELEPEPRCPKRIRTSPKLRRIARPESFSADVFCPDEQLFILYQMLPDTIGLIDALDEGWQFAQEAGTIEGTRSELTFPLARTNLPGHPIEVTIARAAHLPSGKAWKLVNVAREEE